MLIEEALTYVHQDGKYHVEKGVAFYASNTQMSKIQQILKLRTKNTHNQKSMESKLKFL